MKAIEQYFVVLLIAFQYFAISFDFDFFGTHRGGGGGGGRSKIRADLIDMPAI